MACDWPRTRASRRANSLSRSRERAPANWKTLCSPFLSPTAKRRSGAPADPYIRFIAPRSDATRARLAAEVLKRVEKKHPGTKPLRALPFMADLRRALNVAAWRHASRGDCGGRGQWSPRGTCINCLGRKAPRPILASSRCVPKRSWAASRGCAPMLAFCLSRRMHLVCRDAYWRSPRSWTGRLCAPRVIPRWRRSHRRRRTPRSTSPRGARAEFTGRPRFRSRTPAVGDASSRLKRCSFGESERSEPRSRGENAVVAKLRRVFRRDEIGFEIRSQPRRRFQWAA